MICKEKLNSRGAKVGHLNDQDYESATSKVWRYNLQFEQRNQEILLIAIEIQILATMYRYSCIHVRDSGISNFNPVPI